MASFQSEGGPRISDNQATVAGSTPSRESVDLSVVFVARNEEKHIEACIRSTMDAVEQAVQENLLRTVEYILVDSASTDRTVGIASRYPIQIVRLEPRWPLSCGAGCYVGLSRARGTLTAIINADMEIERRWFADALPHFGPDVGGVCGVAKENLSGRTVIERLLVRYSSAPLSEGRLPPEVASHSGGYSTGTLLLRTDAARQVGSYNPYFRAAEDMDLRYRLLRAHWKLPNLPVVQGLHHWVSEAEPADLLSYFATIRRNSIGLGQMARYSLSRDSWIARQAARPCFNGRVLMNALLGGAMVLLVSLHVVVGAAGGIVPGAAVLLGDALIAFFLKKSSQRARMPFRDYLFAALAYPPVFSLVRVLGFVWGFLIAPKGPDEYPVAIGE